jgi:hypothetical protein
MQVDVCLVPGENNMFAVVFGTPRNCTVYHIKGVAFDPVALCFTRSSDQPIAMWERSTQRRLDISDTIRIISIKSKGNAQVPIIQKQIPPMAMCMADELTYDGKKVRVSSFHGG